MAVITIGRTATPGPVPGVATPFGVGKFSVRVYTREDRWDSDWFYEPYLTAIMAKEAAIPGRSRAEFVYHYGRIKREDRSFFGNWRPEDYLDLYVTIVVTPEGSQPYNLWCGIIPAEQLQAHATKITGSSIDPSGNLKFTAFGFDYILDRRRVQGAYVRNNDGSARQIGHSPEFNMRGPVGLQDVGNRSADSMEEFGLPFSFGFADVDDTSMTAWSPIDMLTYMLHWSDEWDGEEAGKEPHFSLNTPGDIAVFLRQVVDVVPNEGRSVWEMLKGLLNRKRGLSATFVWNTGSDGLPTQDGISIQIFSLTNIPSSVDDRSLPRNPHVERIFIDHPEPDIEEAVVVTKSSATFDIIRVQGERTRCVFTAATSAVYGPLFAVIETAWTPANQALYDAAVDTPNIRKTSPLERVYRSFRLPDSFDWTAAGHILNPEFDADGHVQLTTPANHWNLFHRFLNWLPFKKHADLMGEIAESRFEKPFAVLEELSCDGLTGQGTWVLAHNPGEGTCDDAGIPRKYGAMSLTPGDRGMEFDIRAPHAHVIARNHIADADAGEDTADFDYDRMLVTLSLETDTRLAVTVQTGAQTTSQDRRTLVLNVRDAHFWLAAPGTVVGIGADRQLLYRNVGDSIIRDDSPRLREVAALAKAWYGRLRNAVRVTRKGLLGNYTVGVMLDSSMIYGRRNDINSAVTQRSWDFERHTTTIETDFVEFDVRGPT